MLTSCFLFSGIISQSSYNVNVFHICCNLCRVQPLFCSRTSNYRERFRERCLLRHLILVVIGIVSNVLHETDLVRCRSCQKTAEPPTSPDCNQPPRVRPRRVIELGSGLFQANTRRACLFFLLDTILDTRGNFAPDKIESETYLLNRNPTTLQIDCANEKVQISIKSRVRNFARLFFSVYYFNQILILRRTLLAIMVSMNLNFSALQYLCMSKSTPCRSHRYYLR